MTKQLRRPPEEPIAHNGLRNSAYRNEKGEKYCASGAHWVDPSLFAKGGVERSDGLQNTCRDCNTKYQRARRARLKEKA